MADAITEDGDCYSGDITVMGEVSSCKIMACDCTDCQKFSGASFCAVVVNAVDNMKISSTVTAFLKITESGN